MSEGLWTRSQCAAWMKVSVRWLQDSDCPVKRLPSGGRMGKPLIRYDPEEVRAWVDARSAGLTLRQAS